MITKRIIPCLDVRDGRVVKGTNFEGIRDVADPVEMARLYNAAGADELVFYDITASFEGRALFTDILTRVAGISPGSFSAPELTLTLSAPHFSTRSKSSSVLMPPPTVRGIKISPATRVRMSVKRARPSKLAVIS